MPLQAYVVIEGLTTMLSSSFTACASTAVSAMPGPHVSASSAKVSCAVRASVSASERRAATPALCPAQQLTSLRQAARTARQPWPCTHAQDATAGPLQRQQGDNAMGVLGPARSSPWTHSQSLGATISVVRFPGW